MINATSTQTVDPKDYGAVGDGVTDDSTAFRRAFQSGLSISITRPTRFYKITRNIVVESDTTITIENGTKFQSSGSHLFVLEGIQNVSIDGGKISKIEGNTSIDIIDCKNIFISNLHIDHHSGENFDSGSEGMAFNVENSKNVHLNNVSAVNISSKGIRFTQCNNCSLTFSFFENNYRSGISIIGGCQNIVISDNEVKNCMIRNKYGDGLIDIYGGDADEELQNYDITIERNTIIDFGEEDQSRWHSATGIRVNATDGAIVSENYIEPSRVMYAGIRVEEREGLTSTDVTISNNTIKTQKRVDGAGIRISGARASDISVVENTIESTYGNSTPCILIKRRKVSAVAITDNNISWNGGFILYSTRDEGIKDITVIDNTFRGSGNGIFLRHIDKGLVNGNNIKVGGIPIKMVSVDNTLVIGNTLEGSIRSYMRGNSSSSMRNNTEVTRGS